MKIVYGTMLVATLILTAYLVISNQKNFIDIREQVIDSKKSVKPLQKQLNTQQKSLEVLQTELTEFHTEVNTRIAKAEKIKVNIAALNSTLSTISGAEELKNNGEFKKAAELLKTAKDPIWKAGDIFASKQVELRGLMQPIDKVMEKWNSDDGSVDTTKITTSIKAILESIKP